MEKKCRGCNGNVYSKSILQYENMPTGAQNFLTKDELQIDKNIDLKLYQCSCCGLVQILDEPVSYYKNVIRASAVSDELVTYRLKFFKEFFSKYNLIKKRVIEIGSGKGEFLSIISQAGVDAYGIENDENSVEESKKNGVKVFQGFIENEDYKIDAQPFDAFIIMNFLEHIPNPKEFLGGICNNLKDEAIGLVEVPSFDMMLRETMFSELIADHLLYFTKKTLTALLEQSGFEVLECKEIWHDYVLSAVVKKRSATNLQPFADKLKATAYNMNTKIEIWHSQGKKIAVWGASHQALAILALTKIYTKIEFIVDSAKFKQNKYTPGTHLEVVSPMELTTRNVDVVIVMAASFTDEVVQTIKRDYKNLEIAIFQDEKLIEV